MDIVTLISLIFSFAALILAFIFDGGTVSALLKPTAALIVFGGTFGAVGISFPAKRLAKIPKLFLIAFKNKKDDRQRLLQYFLQVTNTVRKDGLLSLEREIENSEYNDEFLKSGFELVTDASDAENLRHTLETKISNMEERHSKGISIFEAAGGYAPTMGVLGTVMGLVHVLGDLSNPEELGGKIAVAFIATLYGVGSANLIWLPIANKLKELDSDEVVTKYMMLDGIILLHNGSNPAIMEEHLKGYLDDAS